jgi:hypothetical protein
MPAFKRAIVQRNVTVLASDSAARCLTEFAPGIALTGLTMGQFSLLDLVAAVLEKTGPADVMVSTWTTGIRDIERAAWLLDTGAIRSFRLLTDRSFPQRQPEYCKALINRFGLEAIRSTRTHAKFAVICNEGWNVVVRSSMNLNTNPRFEQFDLDDSAELAAFFVAHADDQPIGFDESAVSAQWAARDASTVTPREAARQKVAEKRARAILTRHGVP